MNATRQLSALTWKWLALGSFVIAAALVVFALVGSPKGIVFFYWGKYTDYLRRRMRSLHIFRPVEPIVMGQIAGVLVMLALGGLLDFPYWYLFVLAICLAPVVVIERKMKQRVASLEANAAPFALTLANGLKATPAIGKALEHVAGLMEGPVAQEFQLAIKETRLGRSLDEALAAVVQRAGSPKLGTVLIALLIGRQVGGNLIKTLETTASTLRELERLEGVLKQKTAEGRMQMWAMGLAPFILCYGSYKIDNKYFEPLMTNGWVGYGCIILSVIAYAGSLIAARKILTVDI